MSGNHSNSLFASNAHVRDHIQRVHELHALSSIDGRYAERTKNLRSYFSEFALMRHRLVVEIEYFIFLSEYRTNVIRRLSEEEKDILRDLYTDFTDTDALAIKDFEETTNHDVKAVELFIRSKIRDTSLGDVVEKVHICLTSEDTNNISYSLMIEGALADVIYPALKEIVFVVKEFSRRYADLPMLARTHGQPASPTTLGKEIYNFVPRLEHQLERYEHQPLSVKLNGASGNFNAFMVADPGIDWPRFTHFFVESLCKKFDKNLVANDITTQIEPHDSWVELFGVFMHTNNILIDFCQDIWRYVSDDWLVQKPEEGEVGSSTMPHKVNPIDFENGEGQLGLANAHFKFFVDKLSISRLQRDLSDSTVERSFGAAFGHCHIAYQSIKKGMGKLLANEDKIGGVLSDHPEVVTEAIQTILRRVEYPNAYDALKNLSRGKKVTRESLRDFILGLDVPVDVQKEMLNVVRERYIGLAADLVPRKGK